MDPKEKKVPVEEDEWFNEDWDDEEFDDDSFEEYEDED